MPPKPRLSDRRRQACTAGRFRATRQNLSAGSPTHADHTTTNRTAMTVSTPRLAESATAPNKRTLAATNETTAAACQRRGRGMSAFRYRSRA